MVAEGYLNNIETNEEGMQRHGGDIVSFASEKLMKHFHKWQDTHDNKQKSNQKNY